MRPTGSCGTVNCGCSLPWTRWHCQCHWHGVFHLLSSICQHLNGPTKGAPHDCRKVSLALHFRKVATFLMCTIRHVGFTFWPEHGFILYHHDRFQWSLQSLLLDLFYTAGRMHSYVWLRYVHILQVSSLAKWLRHSALVREPLGSKPIKAKKIYFILLFHHSDLLYATYVRTHNFLIESA